MEGVKLSWLSATLPPSSLLIWTSEVQPTTVTFQTFLVIVAVLVPGHNQHWVTFFETSKWKIAINLVSFFQCYWMSSTKCPSKEQVCWHLYKINYVREFSLFFRFLRFPNRMKSSTHNLLVSWLLLASYPPPTSVVSIVIVLTCRAIINYYYIVFVLWGWWI